MLCIATAAATWLAVHSNSPPSHSPAFQRCLLLELPLWFFHCYIPASQQPLQLLMQTWSLYYAAHPQCLQEVQVKGQRGPAGEFGAVGEVQLNRDARTVYEFMRRIEEQPKWHPGVKICEIVNRVADTIHVKQVRALATRL